MKGSFEGDARFGERLFELLDMVFPGLRRAAEAGRALGAAWESVSTPFVCYRDGRPVAHVGVIELPLVLMGRSVTVGTLHAVATHPDYRRSGCYREVMEEALAYSAGRYETLLLSTEHPEYYESFGFRYVPEQRFTVEGGTTGHAGGFRLLNTADPDDVALLQRLLEARAPVSNVVGVGREKAIFCFNEARRPLWYAPELDAIVCLEREGERLLLFDIVGAEIPSLSELLDRMPGRIEEVAIYFSPDRLGVEARSAPNVLDDDGPSYLMVRGPFAAEGRAFGLPRSGRA